MCTQHATTDTPIQHSFCLYVLFRHHLCAHNVHCIGILPTYRTDFLFILVHSCCGIWLKIQWKYEKLVSTENCKTKQPPLPLEWCFDANAVSSIQFNYNLNVYCTFTSYVWTLLSLQQTLTCFPSSFKLDVFVFVFGFCFALLLALEEPYKTLVETETGSIVLTTGFSKKFIKALAQNRTEI